MKLTAKQKEPVMEELSEAPEWCALCDFEAIQFVEHKDGKRTPLCEQCATAYEMGQASPEAILRPIEDWEEEP